DRRGRRAAPQRDGQGRADRPAGAALTPVLCTGNEGAPSFPVHRTGGWEGCGGQTERRVPPSTSRVAPLTHSAAALARNTTAAATSPGSPNRPAGTSWRRSSRANTSSGVVSRARATSSTLRSTRPVIVIPASTHDERTPRGPQARASEPDRFTSAALA